LQETKVGGKRFKLLEFIGFLGFTPIEKGNRHLLKMEEWKSGMMDEK